MSWTPGRILGLTLVLVGCRGNSPASPPPSGRVASPAAVARIALGSGALAFWFRGAKDVDVALDAAGNVAVTPVDPVSKREHAMLTPRGELLADGRPLVKLGDDDAVLVPLHGAWTAIGTLDSNGTFRRADGRVTVAIAAGRVTGLNDRVDIAPGTPARPAMLVVIGLAIGGDRATDALLLGSAAPRP